MNKNFKPIALLSAMLFAVGAGWAGAEHNHGESTPAVTGTGFRSGSGRRWRAVFLSSAATSPPFENL